MSRRFVRTFKARSIFLDQLSEGSSISFAAHAAGGTSSNFKSWRESDENFAEDWDDAIEAGTDTLEDAVMQRAIKKSDSLAMFMLKARRPDKYDRGSKLELSGGLSVEGSKQKLLNKLARLAGPGVLAKEESEEESEVSGLSEPESPKLLPAPDGGALPKRGRKRRAV